MMKKLKNKLDSWRSSQEQPGGNTKYKKKNKKMKKTRVRAKKKVKRKLQ